MPVNVTAKFNLPKFGTKQVAKKTTPASPKKVLKKAIKKAVPKSGTVASGTRAGGVGYRKFEGDSLWLPNTARPDWLDGSLPGECAGCCTFAVSLHGPQDVFAI